MPSRLVALAVVAAAAALAVAPGAGAASAPLPSPGSFLLVPADFGKYAKASPDRTLKLGGLTEYARGFSSGLRAAGQPLASAASLAILAPDAATAAEGYQQIEAATHTAAGRRAVGQEFGVAFAKGVGKNERVLKTTVGAPRFGTDTLVLPVVVKTNRGVLRMPVVLTHVDRVIGALVLISYAGRTVPTKAVDFETAAMRKHLTDAFTVASSAAPTIAGSAVQGQTLTVDEGVWAGAPTSYTYAWSRCASGTCTPIDGATARTYVVASLDSGATLQVAVTGTNTVGSATASSAPTAVVQ
jgi:hypothetical protein